MSWLIDYFKYKSVAGFTGDLVVDTVAQLPAASSANGKIYYITNPASNARAIAWQLRSNGVIWENSMLQLLASSAVTLGYVAINNTTFGTPSAVSTGSGGAGGAAGSSTKITGVAAGSHGLTNAVSQGKYISITGGTGWTAGLYKIIDVDANTNIVEIDTPFTGQGIPTYTAKNIEVELVRIKNPALNLNSFIRSDFSWTGTGSGSKRLRARYGDSGESIATAVVYSDPNVTTGFGNATTVRIQNQNSKVLQVSGTFASSNGGNGSHGGTCTTSAKNTAAITDLIFTAHPASHNEVVQLERYDVLIAY